MSTNLREAIEQDGLSVLSPANVGAVLAELQLAMADSDKIAIRRNREQIAASRNVLRLWPNALTLSRRLPCVLRTANFWDPAAVWSVRLSRTALEIQFQAYSDTGGSLSRLISLEGFLVRC